MAAHSHPLSTWSGLFFHLHGSFPLTCVLGLFWFSQSHEVSSILRVTYMSFLVAWSTSQVWGHTSVYCCVIPISFILPRGPPCFKRILGRKWILIRRNKRNPLNCWCLNWFCHKQDKAANLQDQKCLQRIFSSTVCNAASRLLSLFLGDVHYSYSGIPFMTFIFNLFWNHFLSLYSFWFCILFSTLPSNSLSFPAVSVVLPVVLT